MVGLLIDMADAERLKVEDAGGFEPSDPRLARSEKLYRFAVRHADRFIDEPLLKVGALTELGRFVAQYGNEAEAVYLLRLAASTTELAYGSNAMGPERADVSVALIGTLLRQMKGQEALQEWQIGNQCAETYPALLRECAEIFRIQRATIEVVRAIEVPNPRNVTRALSQVDTLLDADDDFTDLREEPLIQLLELARDLAESGTDPDRAERYSNLLEKLGVEPDEDDDEH
jgi:hypothetical protein